MAEKSPLELLLAAAKELAETDRILLEITKATSARIDMLVARIEAIEGPTVD